ncbi:MAG: D-glycero-beta-D-manno-heptose 1,7-bisphosphate 7-phosphatase [Desulfobacteraceae bacterium]|nr:D-glycero-beta-D-manno-heptose 1,7-bisphosphate 7-phosphatase [Desulfobacteraceae bacterium]
MDKVVFLDRDGVINRDSPDYIKSWDEFEFLPNSLEALRMLTQAGYHLIVITNQSIIGRGWVDQTVLDHTHAQLRAAVAAAGGRIHDIFFCPHHPDDGCDCRKPKPGLIIQAQKKYEIDLSTTVMIGDNAKDILCGRNAGCGQTILVRTGDIAAAEQKLAELKVQPDYVVSDLLAAARIILKA